jgi:7-cyano-7-deazaguanine synthase
MKILHCVILSGGMDSATLLYHVYGIAEDELYALSFDYGQRHRRELECAAKLAGDLYVSHQIIPLDFLKAMTPKSSLTDDSVPTPEGHYAADNMKQTVVPGRNTLFLSIALASAQGRLATLGDDWRAVIYYGAHAGDHTIYPDCRKAYVRNMEGVIEEASEERVELMVPFLDWSKGDIAEYGVHSLEVPFEHTHTCYNGTVPACGKCGSCTERLSAFDDAFATDPLEYADRESYKKFTREV